MATSASSAGVDGFPTTTNMVAFPTDCAGFEFASGVPTVSCAEVCAGELQEPNASGGPWVRSGDVHRWYAGTSGTTNGVAPFGRA